MWLIYNPINKLYWSNDWGWGDRAGADRYDTKDGTLPIDGKWVKA
jgi:hypothetical protein